jgi:prolyl-tRNA editing enzyme YbaK/EbsC (Cys-tRNA(Pro) deacylase)
VTAEQELPERSRIVQQRLRDAGFEIEVRELPDSTRTAAEAASALGCDVGAIASSLLFIADGEPLLVLTSGRHRVDTAVLAHQLAAYDIELATAAHVREVTGQAIGGVAPIGHPAPVRTVIDTALADHPVIWAAAGTPHTVMPLTIEQLTELTGAPRVHVADD